MSFSAILSPPLFDFRIFRKFFQEMAAKVSRIHRCFGFRPVKGIKLNIWGVPEQKEGAALIDSDDDANEIEMEDDDDLTIEERNPPGLLEKAFCHLS